MKKFLRIILAASIIIMSLASVMGTAVSAEVSATDAVASIGTQYFASLNDAIIAAQEGDTITVLKDVSVSSSIEISGKAITLQGEGTTKPVITGASPAFKLYSSAKLTVKNLSFTGFTNVIYVGGESTSNDNYFVELDGVDISFAASGAVYAYKANKIELYVYNSTFTAGATGNAIFNPVRATTQGCYVDFQNNTLNNGCLEINAGAASQIIRVADLAPGAEMSGDTMAIANGAVARIGDTTSGKLGEVYFKDLSLAALAAENGDTIYILSDIENFAGATYSGKTLKFVGLQKFTITPSAAKYAFTLLSGAGIVVENLNFEGYTGRNFIVFSSAGGGSGVYNITVKDTDVDFKASGAIYGYNCDDAIINIENSSFTAGASGNCVLNFTNGGCYGACTLNLTDITLNEKCGVVTDFAADAVVNETFTTDALAKQNGIRVRVGATEGGKVGEVYFRTIDAATIKSLPVGTKITVFCSHCGESQEIEALTCQTVVPCTCGTEMNGLADHAYTEATCQTKSKCEWCQEELGNFAEHQYSVATCANKATCSVCGAETGNLLRHKDKNADGICDNCNFNINGDVSTDTGANNSNNVTTTAAANNAEAKKGCGGTVTVAGLALVASLGSCAIFVEKKRR